METRFLAENGFLIYHIARRIPFYHGYPYASQVMRYREGQMLRKHLDRLGVILPQRSQ